MDPGQEFLVVHLDLVRASEGFADSVLDGSDDPLHCPNTSVMLGECDPEFNRCKFDVESGNDLHLSEYGVDPDDARGCSQCKGASESTGDALGAVVMEDLQVDGAAGEAEHHENPSFQCDFALRGQDGPKISAWQNKNGG